MSNPELSDRLTKTAPAAWLNVACPCGSRSWVETTPPGADSQSIALVCTQCGITLLVASPAAEAARSLAQPKSVQR